MIAGIVSGTCVGIAWIVGFVIYFVKRRRRDQVARAAGFHSHKDYIFTKAIANPPTYIIPPDPALVDAHLNTVVEREPVVQNRSEPHADIHSVPPSPSIQRKYSQSEYTPATGSSTPMLGGFSNSIQDSTASFLSTKDSDSHLPGMSVEGYRRM
jgi:hypothetical protein